MTNRGFIIKPNKHDRYVEQLVRQIKAEYDTISTHLKFERRKRLVGEVDVIAIRGNEMHLFEVKCSYRIVKARKQLLRLRRLFPDYDTSCFFYCGMGDRLVEVC